jgi:uncharacterized protein
MDCPVDGTQLLMAERHGVEIDYCPQCRGVWPDRGELDKIIEHVESEWNGRRVGREHDEEYEDERGHGHKRSRLSSFFEGFGD